MDKFRAGLDQAFVDDMGDLLILMVSKHTYFVFDVWLLGIHSNVLLILFFYVSFYCCIMYTSRISATARDSTSVS
jgi:hypothetical protein